MAGTIGEPGERAFFIQARNKGRVISVALEKAQVQAIANRLELIVAEVKKSNPLIAIESFPQDDAPLETPVDEEFQVGAISLAWNELDQLLSFELYELEDDDGPYYCHACDLQVAKDYIKRREEASKPKIILPGEFH